MKKLLSIISAAIVISAIGAATIIHSKADMKIETADFAVSSDRTRTPSAYCRNADGSAISSDFSSSENFCISQYAYGNMSFLSYDNLPAYCIGNHLQNAPVSLTQVTKYSDIPYDSDEYGAIFRIAASGASTGHTEYNLNENDLYYVTQCAVRAFLYNISPESLAFYSTDGTLNENMTSEFRRISSAASEPSEPEFYTLVTESNYDEAKQMIIDNRSYHRYGPYIAYSPETEINEYNIYTDENEHIIISLSENPVPEKYTEHIPFEIPFYIFIESSYKEEVTLSLNAEISRTKYSPTVYLTSDNSFQNIFQIKMSEVNEQLSTELKLQNINTTGDIQLNKKFIADGFDICDKQLICQPRFSVMNKDGLYVNGIQTSDNVIFDCFSEEPVLFCLSSDSTLSVSGLPLGEYYVCEAEGAFGYTAEVSEVPVNNTPELNTCEIINVSETTTPVTTTTAITTTPVTTTTIITTTPEITFSLTETTLMTDITTSETTTDNTTTYTETTSEISTTSETTPSSSSVTTTTKKTTPSNPRVPYSPKTGETSSINLIIITAAAAGLISLKAFRKI